MFKRYLIQLPDNTFVSSLQLGYVLIARTPPYITRLAARKLGLAYISNRQTITVYSDSFFSFNQIFCILDALRCFIPYVCSIHRKTGLSYSCFGNVHDDWLADSGFNFPGNSLELLLFLNLELSNNLRSLFWVC